MTRISPSAPVRIERLVRTRGYAFVAGIDEAGRGCLAGPVVAAAVILPPDALPGGIVDSKLLSAAGREERLAEIRSHALAIGIGLCTPEEIDRLNILRAALEAMRRAVDVLALRPDFLLIDGNRTFDSPSIPARAVVKGDRRCRSIAAASIVAKVTRDGMMADLHQAYPEYGLDRHKGYPTAQHYEALARFGPSPFHRRSFRLASRTGR